MDVPSLGPLLTRTRCPSLTVWCLVGAQVLQARSLLAAPPKKTGKGVRCPAATCARAACLNISIDRGMGGGTLPKSFRHRFRQWHVARA